MQEKLKTEAQFPGKSAEAFHQIQYIGVFFVVVAQVACTFCFSSLLIRPQHCVCRWWQSMDEPRHSNTPDFLQPTFSLSYNNKRSLCSMSSIIIIRKNSDPILEIFLHPGAQNLTDRLAIPEP